MKEDDRKVWADYEKQMPENVSWVAQSNTYESIDNLYVDMTRQVRGNGIDSTGEAYQIQGKIYNEHQGERLSDLYIELGFTKMFGKNYQKNESYKGKLEMCQNTEGKQI